MFNFQGHKTVYKVTCVLLVEKILMKGDLKYVL